MLEKFRAAKQGEMDRLILESAARSAAEQFVCPVERKSFSLALKKAGEKGCAIIAEYKRASPSRGKINTALAPDAAAQMYATAGAAAISVLTESRYFGGSLEFLDRMSGAGVPLLRKDFIFHPLQVIETARTAASAILVIVRMLDDASFAEILDTCEKVQLEPVVEVFSREDLERAQGARAGIIQVNNRDLETLKTDFEVSRQLIAHKKEGELWISASGYEARQQLDEMSALGFDAFLIGTSLMSDENPGEALAALTRK